MKNILIFGACGSIGNHIFKKMSENTFFHVYGTSRQYREEENIIKIDNNCFDGLLEIPNIDIIVWAQGDNFNDNIQTFDLMKYKNMMDANINFILESLQFLLIHEKINDGAKMVIISSIWENLTRENKLSYSISKSALSGLVKNLSYDLGKKNILINNVLPGVIDNEMTRKTLKPEEIEYITNYTNFCRMISLDDVYNTIYFLVFENTGITGQSIVVDLGFSNIRKYS
jgi:hypothetical protein